MIKLRGFLLSDLKEVVEIGRTSFPQNRVYSQNYFKNLYQKYPKFFIVAEESGEIAGFIVGKTNKKEGKIISLAVDPCWRKLGVGKKLTEFLSRLFQKQKIHSALLHVRENNKEAIYFYKNLGFKILKEIKKYYRNGGDAFLMKKTLGD